LGVPVVDFGVFSVVRYHQLQVCNVDKDYGNYERPKVTPIAGRTRGKTAKRGQLEYLMTPTRPPRAQATRALPIDDLCKDLSNFYFDSEDEDEDGLTSELVWSPTTPISATAAGSVPAADDEQIVNMALIIFLSTATMYHPDVRAEWTAQRKSFKFSNLFEARVDGFLRKGLSDKVGAILEVKAYTRELKQHQIQMQESAQMAAWIYASPDGGELDRLAKGKEMTR
jgi:hypothetical protein